MDKNQTHIVEQAITSFRKGEIIILMDDRARENEGDFVQSAQCVTPQSVNFMITEGRGLLCCAISETIASQLALQLQVEHNSSLYHTAFTVSVDARDDVSTGVSAHDRAKTVQIIASETSVPDDLVRPGHMFPIIAHKGGLQDRLGHTEAVVELSQHVGHRPAGVMCEMLNREGRSAERKEIANIAKTHNLVVLDIEDLYAYLMQYNKQ